MKYHKKIQDLSRQYFLIAGFSVVAGLTAGCSWDSGLYDRFVSRDGGVISCAGVEKIFLQSGDTEIHCDIGNSNDGKCHLELFSIVKNGEKISYDDCAEAGGSELCQGRQSLFSEYRDVFDFQICPANYHCNETAYSCESDYDDSRIYCDGVSTDPKTDRVHCGARGLCNSGSEDSEDYRGAECDPSMICSNGSCIPSCTNNQVFCGGMCINPLNDSRYCGAKLNGECSSDDTEHADYKGEACGSGFDCVAGVCERNRCVNDGETVCMVDGVRGCHDTRGSDRLHCGACNYICSEHSIPNASSDVCSGGNCMYICNEGYVNVSGLETANEIKCIDPDTDSAYCGATSAEDLGVKCEQGKVCVNGSCEINSCNDSEMLCYVDGKNECRNIKGDDAEHCGACNFRCSENAIPNAKSESCESGHCVYQCNDGFVNVTGSSQAGKIRCIDPQSDNNYCNAAGPDNVGEPCTGGKICVAGKCVQNNCSEELPNLCIIDIGDNRNEAQCKNVRSNDADHCGTCNFRCADHPIQNAVSSECHKGDCIYECAEDLVNVGSDNTSGTILCINPKTDKTHCGASDNNNGTPCSDEQVCVNGRCEYNSCTIGTLCYNNEKSQNECIDINSGNADHCGACNYKCSEHPIQNAVSNSCVGNMCEYECINGYVNVSTGKTANTIKCIDPKIDNTYCGASDNNKGTPCSKEQVCVNGRCEYNSCSIGTLCYNNKTSKNECIDINSGNADHCGACNYKCSEHPIQNAVSNSCAGNMCEYECINGYVNVSTGKTANTIKCIDPKTDNIYCGARIDSKDGDNCTNQGKVCSGGVCKNICSEGETTCSDGCKIIKSDLNNCGGCGRSCYDIGGGIDNVASVSCVNYSCTDLTCKPDAHIYNAPTGQQCEPDSLENCGSHGNQCTETNGTASCISDGNGKKCSVSSCNDEYHIYNDSCELDDTNNCGAHDNTCKVENGTPDCISDGHGVKKCGVSSCNDGYHIYNDSCELDDITNCGAHDNTCKVENGTPDCISEGGVKKCGVSSCNDGYHIYNDSCELDDITNCASHDNTCKVENGTPDCISEGGVKKCSVSSCNDGYHIYNDSCELDDITNCGSHGKRCTETNGTASCISEGGVKKCSVSSCNDGYQIIDDQCVSDA